MAGGRPTDYKPEILQKARNYIADHEAFEDPIPSVAGLACVLGLTRETLYAWARDETKPEFSDILRELMQKQERQLLRGGLVGNFNAPITKMILTKHGYSDKVEQDHTSSDGSMTPKPTEIILRAADDASDD
jgi:hypothetical protein